MTWYAVVNETTTIWICLNCFSSSVLKMKKWLCALLVDSRSIEWQQESPLLRWTGGTELKRTLRENSIWTLNESIFAMPGRRADNRWWPSASENGSWKFAKIRLLWAVGVIHWCNSVNKRTSRQKKVSIDVICVRIVGAGATFYEPIVSVTISQSAFKHPPQSIQSSPPCPIIK